MWWPFVVFGTLFMVELPDKTSLVSLAFVSRCRPFWVWLTASAALVAQTVLALTAGRVLSLVPRTPLRIIESLLFLVISIWIWKESREAPKNTSTPFRPVENSRLTWILPRIFAAIFAAEFLDLTQMATLTFAAAHPRSLWEVGVAASMALIAANGLVVGFGRILTGHVSAVLVQRAAAGVFAIIGLSFLGSLSLFHGL